MAMRTSGGLLVLGVLGALATVVAIDRVHVDAAAPNLQGVWKCVSYVRDGRPVPIDAIMIISRGYFSRVESDHARPSLEGIDFRKPASLSPEQLRRVAESFPRANASAGTYRIEADTFFFTSMTHHNPDAVGHEAKRRIALTGDRLVLSGPAGSGVLEETWQRVEKF